MMPAYSSPTNGIPMQAGTSYHSQDALSYNYPQVYHQERRLNPSGMNPYEPVAPSSPEDQKSSHSDSPSRRPVLTLPPHITNRYSPPLSDSRDDHEGSFSGLSPPQSPMSAVSSSSIPGGKQINLAPLRTLVRAQSHPYRRDKFDDKALMALSGRKASE